MKVSYADGRVKLEAEGDEEQSYLDKLSLLPESQQQVFIKNLLKVLQQQKAEGSLKTYKE